MDPGFMPWSRVGEGRMLYLFKRALLATGIAAALIGAGVAAHAEGTGSIMTAARPAILPQLSFGSPANPIHVFPTVAVHSMAKAAGLSGGPLTYHNGPIMGPSLTVYNIFWSPNS